MNRVAAETSTFMAYESPILGVDVHLHLNKHVKHHIVTSIKAPWLLVISYRVSQPQAVQDERSGCRLERDTINFGSWLKSSGLKKYNTKENYLYYPSIKYLHNIDLSSLLRIYHSNNIIMLVRLQLCHNNIILHRIKLY